MGQKVQLNKENMAVLLFNKKKLIWEDRTMSVSTIFTAYYYGKFTGYNIYFYGANKNFFYKEENVEFLNKVNNINIEKQDVYVDGEIVTASKLDQFEKGYFRVYIGKDAIFTKNISLKSSKYKDIFTYYSKLAEYAGKIAEKESPLYFLTQNYRRISTPSNDSVLTDYLQGECKPISDDGLMLLPFDFNQSQVRAIDAVLKNKISIIEGPPGTGKTQTILNLIANIICRGKNCAVVSNNNTAIENVYEKMIDEKLSFIAATLGRQTNVLKFFESEHNEELSWFLEQQEESIKVNDSSKITELSVQMKKIQDAEIETAILESQHIDIQNEKRHYDKYSNDTIIINQKLYSNDYMAFIMRLENPKKLGFFERWRLGRKTLSTVREVIQRI